MNPRTTGILFLLAAALAAFVYLYEIWGGETRKQAEEQAKRLFPELEADDVTWFELTAQDGTPVRVERREERWELVEPLVFPADSFTADGVASALAQLSSEGVLENPQSPAVYGLDADEGEVRFGAGETSRSLRVGDKTPMGANSYASIGGDERVYTIPTASTHAFRKQLDDLRDKRILSFDSAGIERIALRWPDGGVVIARAGDGWRLREPLDVPADPATVDALLSDLSFLRASGFEDDPPPDEETGLDRPAFSAELVARPAEEGGEAPVYRVAIGRALDGGSRLVRGARPQLYRIPAERIEDFPREVVAYRFRDLAAFPEPDAVRVEIAFHPQMSSTAGEGPLVLTATHGDSGWSSTPEAFAPGALERLVSELSRLRAEDVLAESAGEEELRGLGLSPPNAVYTVYGEDPETPLARVQIGVLRGEDGIVARAADRDTIYLLDYELAEHLPVSLQAFRNRFAAAEEPAPEDAAPSGAETEPDSGATEASP